MGDIERFVEFKRKMDREILNPTERVLYDMNCNIDDLIAIISMQSNFISALIELQKNTECRFSALADRFYEMFPEADIIEVVAENEEERLSMYKSYLNLNEDFTADAF